MSSVLIKRRSERLRVNLFARCRNGNDQDRDVVLINITPEGCCMSGFGTNLAVGQPVIIRLASEDALSGTVRWISDEQAGVEFDAPLPRARVEHLRFEHSAFLAEVSEPERRVTRPIV